MLQLNVTTDNTITHVIFKHRKGLGVVRDTKK